MITLITKEYQIKQGTKTVWELVSEQTEQIENSNVDNFVSSMPFFRRLGGSETLTSSYTCQGYKPTLLVSKSPCRTIKKVRSFIYDSK